MTSPRFDLERRCTPRQSWPGTDQAAWEAAIAPHKLLETDSGLASHWAPRSRALVESSYGRWLGWLERSGDLDAFCAPGARVTRERVELYLAMLEGLQSAPYTIATRIRGLADAIRVMEPAGEWHWLVRAANRAQARATPVKDVAGRLQPAEEVLQLGLDMMEAADHSRFRGNHDRAILFRDGLILAALVLRPVRISNYAGIIVGGQLRRAGDGWQLVFSSEETKTRRALEFPWPDGLAPSLERYLDHHRPMLFQGKNPKKDTNALWVATGGAALSTSELTRRITMRTADEFGTGINPHSFRDIAATTIATEDPENITGVPSVLGHTRLETSERHYNKAKMVDATCRYQDAVGAIRKGRGGSHEQLEMGRSARRST